MPDLQDVLVEGRVGDVLDQFTHGSSLDDAGSRERRCRGVKFTRQLAQRLPTAVGRQAVPNAVRRSRRATAPVRTGCSQDVRARSAKIQGFPVSCVRAPLTAMTYVVTETCIRCKYTDCVDVCPVDCFREGPEFPGHRPGRVHRLHAVRRRVPGGGDLRRGRRAARAGAVQGAQRRARRSSGSRSSSASPRRRTPTSGRTCRTSSQYLER